MLASSNNLGLLVIVEQSTNYNNFQQFTFLNQWLNEKYNYRDENGNIMRLNNRISCSNFVVHFSLHQMWLVSFCNIHSYIVQL